MLPSFTTDVLHSPVSLELAAHYIQYRLLFHWEKALSENSDNSRCGTRALNSALFHAAVWIPVVRLMYSMCVFRAHFPCAHRTVVTNNFARQYYSRKFVKF